MIEEIWKDVVGFEDRYQVSSLGGVRSKDMILYKSNGRIEHKKGRYIKLHPDNRGYITHTFCSSNGIRKRMSIHRVVATAFIPNPDNKPQIDHIDRNRANNSIDNLRWCTLKENMNNPLTLEWLKVCRPNYAHSEETKKNISKSQIGRTVRESTREKLRQKAYPICQYTIDGVFVQHFNSSLDASNILGISRSHILSCCKGRRHTAGGYRWIYKSNFIENSILPPIKHKKRSSRVLNEAQKELCRMKLIKARKSIVRPVVQLDDNGNTLCKFNSITEACNSLGLDTGCVTRCCQGKIKHTKNFYFKYG